MIESVDLGGRHVVYESHGTGPNVVFITGLGSTRRGWWKQVPVLSRWFRTITLDNRDAGESGHASVAYTIGDMADDVAAVIRAAGGRAHVVGISLGGMVAQEVALRHPELVDRLVLVGTTAGGAFRVQAAPEMLALLMDPGGATPDERVRRSYAPIAGPGYFAAHPDDLQRLGEFALTNRLTAAGYMRQLGAAMHHDTVTRLAAITAPTLVIHGADDPLVPPENGRRLAAAIPGARLLMLPCVGHIPHIEVPDAFNEAVISFLAGG